MLALAAGGQAVRLAAPRRFGKTTLLGELADAAWQAHEMVPAIVDLSRVTSIQDVVVRVTRAYHRGLDRGRLRAAWRSIHARLSAEAQVGVPGARLGAAIAAPGPERDWLAALHEVLDIPVAVHTRTGQRCLVVLDEFQDLLTVDADLDGVMRSHLQHQREAASYVFAGSQPSMMAALFGDRSRPLFEQARSMSLDPLPVADLGDHIAERLERHGRGDLLDHAGAVAAISEGHPQRAMLLAHMLFEQGPKAEDPVGRALTMALREAADGLEQTWRALPATQRRVLGAIAAGHAAVLSNAALEYTGHGKSTQASARDALIAATLLRRDGGGSVGFVDPFMRLWIREGTVAA